MAGARPAVPRHTSIRTSVPGSCLQNGDLDRLISGEGIWRCGQCFSCHARCPRDNSPATAILALREKAVRKGVVSQDIADIESVLGRNLRETGQTLLPTSFIPPLGSLGERTRTRFTENPGARVRFGYREGSARAVDIPEDYRRTIRRILDRTGFG
ncbi:MAG: hypothetical protein ACLFS6_09315 [Methanomassiliicoccales archaeon]